MGVLNLVRDYRKLYEEVECRERMNVAKAVPAYNSYILDLRKQLHSVYAKIKNAYIDFNKDGENEIISMIFLDETVSSFILYFITQELLIEDDNIGESFTENFVKYVSHLKLTSITKKILLHPDVIDLILDFLKS